MLLLSAKCSRLLSDGKTQYERRFGEPFKGPIIPFGSLVEFSPLESINLERKCSLESSSAMYLLYAEGIWKGYILVADLEELEEMDASEIHAVVILPKMGQEFIFSVADGTLKPFGGDQAPNTSILIRNQPTRGESHHDFLGESKGSLSPPQDSYPEAGEAQNDF